MFPGLCEFGEF